LGRRILKNTTMEHLKVTYDPIKKDLKVYWNDKLVGGMIGKIAKMKFEMLCAEIAKCDSILEQAKNIINGNHKAKKTEI
jgi:uncharacterized protein YigE (DUF2233 family)